MIEYREADLFDVIPEFARGVVVAHVCNNIGAWGAGFTRGLSQRFPETERAFRVWSDPRRLGQGPVRVHTTSGRYALGAVQLVRLSDAVSVVNMVAQVGIGVGPRLDYAALGTCLSYLAVAGPVQDAGVVLIPRLGCGLAGGSWAKVEPLLAKHLSGVRVVVCTRPGEKFNP